VRSCAGNYSDDRAARRAEETTARAEAEAAERRRDEQERRAAEQARKQAEPQPGQGRRKPEPRNPWKLEKVEQAIMAYRRAAEVTPHSSYPFSNLALLYMIVRDRTHMIETYKRVEQLAWNEVQADVDNYWAYADLIVSRLALGKIKQAEDILETALDTAPPDSPYALESLLDTLRRLADVVEPQDRPPIIHVMTYIEGFKQRRSKQKRVLEN